jgi:hypothetical protein
LVRIERWLDVGTGQQSDSEQARSPAVVLHGSRSGPPATCTVGAKPVGNDLI